MLLPLADDTFVAILFFIAGIEFIIFEDILEGDCTTEDSAGSFCGDDCVCFSLEEPPKY